MLCGCRGVSGGMMVLRVMVVVMAWLVVVRMVLVVEAGME